MAKRAIPDRARAVILDADEMRRGIKRLEKRLNEVESFDPQTLDHANPRATVRPLSASVQTALMDTFGDDSIEYRRFASAATFSWPLRIGAEIPHHQKIQSITDAKTNSIQLLSAAIDMLKERVDDLGEAAPARSVPLIAEQAIPKRVFIVHGQDEGPKEAVARLISSLGLIPVILHEQANKGRTIIQKFRDEAADVGFAIILMTPDDEINNGQRRARQNVILELGFFLGVLGPERVAAIVKDEIERPSDFDGVVYIPYNDGWRASVAKELDAAGYEIDWNIIMRG